MTVRNSSRSEGGSRADRDGTCESGFERPRVVILEAEGGPQVAIVEMSEAVRPGDLFCHLGARWQVTATRTRNRVLIAEPFRA